MKSLSLAILLLLAFPLTAFASDAVTLSPVDDITTNFENLSDYAGLGSLVALVVVVMRLTKLPDGYGGYAGVGVGVFAYVASLVLPEASRKILFEALDHASKLLTVVLGSSATHYGLKYVKLDRLWKGND